VRRGEVSWLQAFGEYARRISPIGMSPRHSCDPSASLEYWIPRLRGE